MTIDVRTVSISALQHYVFCPRQCGYIHIERAWEDNYLTAKGNQLHERVHSEEAETRGDLRTERGVQVSSMSLGISGKLDLLEIRTDPLKITPVEYKKGKPKTSDCDRVQLCAQALCLEEMRSVSIQKAAIWYFEVRQREWIDLDDALRDFTLQTIEHTRAMLESQCLPTAVYSTACKACSFYQTCNPKLQDHSSAYVAELFKL